MTDSSVTTAATNHLVHVAELYRECFPDNFRSRLGQAPCRRFYEHALSHEGYRVQVCIRTGEVAGFAFLSLPPHASLSARWVLPFWHVVLGRILAHPVYFLSLFARRIRRRLTAKRTDRSPSMAFANLDHSMELIDLAVSGRHRRQGIGRDLIHGSINLTRDLGLPGLKLTVDNDNTSAVSFYQDMGFEKVCADEQSGTSIYNMAL